MLLNGTDGGNGNATSFRDRPASSYPVIGLNLGKLEPGKYEVKWIIQPLVFTKFDGDGKALDTNWPMDERRPTRNRPNRT